jgi:hypothetical protein
VWPVVNFHKVPQIKQWMPHITQPCFTWVLYRQHLLCVITTNLLVHEFIPSYYRKVPTAELWFILEGNDYAYKSQTGTCI